MKVEEYEPRSISDDVVREYHALAAANAKEARPLDPPVPLEVIQSGVRALPEFIEAALFLVRDGDRPVGFALLSHRRGSDNAEVADLQLWADPSHRRRGAAASLLDAVCRRAAERGHTVLTTRTTEGVGWGKDLCLSLGAEVAVERRTWRLPLEKVDRDHIRSVSAQAAERARGYDLIDVSDRLPDELIEEAVELLQFLNTEDEGVPQSQQRRITVESLRQMEEVWKAIGIRRRWQFARHEPSGSLAGVVDAIFSPTLPGTITQDNSVVRPEFRGRSLALWMKACMIDKALDAWPEARDIRTTTTAPNGAMDSIDDRLGFEPYVLTTVWQVSVSAVKDWLASDRRRPDG